MPPKKKAAVKPAAPPLENCLIALSGTFAGHSQASIERHFIDALGAALVKTVNDETTHLISTDVDFAKTTTKIKQAKAKSIPIVRLTWLEDCLSQNTRLKEDKYLLGSSSTTTTSAAPSAPAPAPAVATNGKANGSRKRGAVKVEMDDDDEDEQPKKKTKSMVKEEEKVIEPVKDNLAKSKDLSIPVDETCPLTHYRVYIDDSMMIWDASLNQTNASNNNNKFYRLQVLHNGGGDYKTWTRWGRVGERGQSAILGSGDLLDAIREFNSKFKSKTGLSWDDRGGKPKSGKYTFVERSYDDDSDEEEEATTKKEVENESPAPESKLDPAIQELMELIFNQNYFAATMSDLNYDVKKLPLGKLSKATLTRGYQALKDLSALLNDPSLAESEYGESFAVAKENLSNAFYSVIPHAFGRDRPPVIQTQDLLKKEVDLLDSLGDMKEASNILKDQSKDAEKINALDAQFKGLNMNEMTPLKSNSQEFLELKNYLTETRGATHHVNYQISQIFRIERNGEKERFEKSQYSGPPRDRRLLWHGSRATNFGGILSQGLRIAPPEAPVSGYMFGKGIYLADMSSKSSNYCCAYNSGGHALLLLCEAELGDPMHTLTNASYTAGEDAKSKGMFSTWGQGSTGPSQWKDAEVVHPSLKGIKIPDVTVKPGSTKVKGAYLQYNEYITYDVAQVRLRYLFRVKM